MCGHVSVSCVVSCVVCGVSCVVCGLSCVVLLQTSLRCTHTIPLRSNPWRITLDTILQSKVSFVNGINQTHHSTNEERPCNTTLKMKFELSICQSWLWDIHIDWDICTAIQIEINTDTDMDIHKHIHTWLETHTQTHNPMNTNTTKTHTCTPSTLTHTDRTHTTNSHHNKPIQPQHHTTTTTQWRKRRRNPCVFLVLLCICHLMCVERDTRETDRESQREDRERKRKKERLKDRQRGRPNKLHTQELVSIQQHKQMYEQEL